MAGEKVIGKIDSLEGDGKVLIIRSTGERVVAKPGDAIFEGDTVTTSASSRAVVTIDNGGLSGTASVSGAESARFDGALFDQAASQIASSSKGNPANVGTKPSNNTIRAFNETFPEDGITTTETVINLEEEFDPTSGGNNPEGPRDTGVNQFTNIERTQLEEIPDAGTPTDTGTLGRSVGEEEIPGDGFGFRNLGDGTDQEEIPTSGLTTDNDFGDNQDPVEEVGEETDTSTDTSADTIGADSDSVTLPDVDAATNVIADTGTTDEDTLLTVNASNGVLSNDSDSDDTLSVVTFTVDGDTTVYNAGSAATLPSNAGSIILNTDGGYVYDPGPNFNGPVPVITYTTNTGSSSTLSIEVTPVDDTPVTAIADSRTVSEDDVSVSGNVVNGTNASADSVGIDGTAVTGVAVGNSGAAEITTGVGGSGVAGAFGTLTIDSAGEYTYVTNDAAQALAGGASATDTFSYTIKDSDGDFSTTTVTLTVTGADDTPLVTIPNDDTLGPNTDDLLVAENVGAPVAGTFTISAVDGGLASVQIGGTTILAADLLAASAGSPEAITGETFGELLVTGYDAATGVVSYTYDPTGASQDHSAATNDILAESLAIVVTDGDGKTATGTLDIGITDTAPTAVADVRIVSEDQTGIAGDVILGTNASADTIEADATTVTGVAAGNSGATEITTGVGGAGIAGTYGTLIIGANGAYTYATNDAAQALVGGASATDTFSYTIKDSDGDFSTTTVTLTVTGADDTPLVTIPNDDTLGANTDDLLVAENVGAPAAGTFTISAVDGGLASVQIGGTTILAADLLAASTGSPEAITGETFGELLVTDYDAATGIISYTYDPTGTSQDHSSATNDILAESLAIVVTDGDGKTATGTLDIGITDTAPTAAPDTNSVTEDATPNPIVGDVITGTISSGSGSGGADTQGADTSVSITGVEFDSTSQTVGSVFNTEYGTLDLNADGTYTYTLDNANSDVQDLEDGESFVETVSYTIEDTDGDTSTSTLTITINGADEAPVVTIPDDNGVVVGDKSVVESISGTSSGTFTVASAAGLHASSTALSITSEGATTTDLTLAQLNNLSVVPVPIPGGTDGELILTGYNAGTGVVSYTFNPTGTTRDHSAGDESVIEQYSIVATDTAGNSNTAEVLDILITDTNPDAQNDSRSISEGTSAIAGNAVGISGAASGDVADTIIDPVTVTDIDFGATDGTVGSNLAGDYGTIVISSAGVYTYTLDNDNATVQGLKNSDSLVETFTYTLTDNEAPNADSDTATITVTINGVDDALPTVVVDDDNGGGTPGENSVIEASGGTVTGEITVTATAGIQTLTIAGQNVVNATAVPVVIAGSEGTLTVTGFNAATGVISYSYVEDGDSEIHTNASSDTNIQDSFAIVLTDNEGDSAVANSLDILITDTAPVAVADTRTLAEDDPTISGNVITGTNASADTIGADTTTVTGVAAGNSGAAEIATGVGGSGIAGTYGTLIIGADGAYTYQTNSAAQGIAEGASATDTFSYTIKDADGDFSTTTVTMTVTGSNDAPVNTNPVLVTADTSTQTAVGLFSSGDNLLSVTDVDDNLSTVTVTVSSGTITVGADQNGATSSGDGTSSITISIGAGSEADVQAILGALRYTPTATAGDVTLTIVSTDSAGVPLSDTDVTLIRVVDDATTPTLGSVTPDSTGLLHTVYNTEDSINLSGEVVMPADNPNTIVTNANTLEATIEGSGATPSAVNRDTSGVGAGLLGNIVTSPLANDAVENLDAENTAQSFTGLIYLTGGAEYSFSGSLDDVVHIELGGQTVISSTGPASNSGIFNTTSPTITSGVTTTPFTAPVDGYYTLEIYNGNVDSNGKILLNISENGVPSELNVQDYSIFSNVDDLIAAGGSIGSFNSNEGGAANEHTDGGYFATDADVNLVGKSGSAISLALLPIQTTGSDILASITISDIPDGVTLTDGTNTYNNSSGGLASSGTMDLASPLNPAGIGFWDLSKLTISGLPTNATVDTIDYALQITATATNATGNDTAPAMAAQTFTIGVLPADFLTDSDNSVSVDPIISSEIVSNDDLIVGSAAGDTLTATNQSGQIIHGGQGADVITGGDDNVSDSTANGNNTLFGNSGDDVIDGKSGDDIIFGGTGSDRLTGGSGSDIFVWQSADGDDSTDVITDFTQGSGGDVIDLSSLLTNAYSDNIGNFVTQTFSGSNSTLSINTDGVAGADITIEVTGMTDNLATLISNGNLIVDSRQIIEGTKDTNNLIGTTADEIFFPRGVDAGNSRDNITLGGGADKISYESGDTFVSDGAEWNGVGMAQINGFTLADTSLNTDADVLDLSDLLVTHDGVQQKMSELTTAEQAEHIFFGAGRFSNSDTTIFVNVDSEYTSSAIGGSDNALDFIKDNSQNGDLLWGSSISAAEHATVGTDMIFEVKGVNIVSYASGLSGVDINTTDFLQSLKDLGTFILD